jgi:hypothetical protein
VEASDSPAAASDSAQRIERASGVRVTTRGL